MVADLASVRVTASLQAWREPSAILQVQLPGFLVMDEFRARRVVDSLRDRGVNAHLLRGGVSQFGVRVSLPGGVFGRFMDGFRYR